MTTLLATKLFAPPLHPTLIRRPRLLKSLDRALRCKLTIISAPAGSGKSTLISEWKTTRAEDCLTWVTLDSTDNDPTQFWSYVVGALATCYPGIGEAMTGLLNASPPVASEALVTNLINTFIACSNGREMILVLDDYHAIEKETIHHALTFLLDHLPPRLHLIIATRVDPALPLARLRIRGQLTELHDLCFTTEEAFEFLHDGMGIELTMADANRLVEQTEGWIAGLQVAALVLREHPDIPSFLQTLTGEHRYVLDFLAKEVLERQPEEIQMFLLLTSPLKSFSAGLCDAITGRDDSYAVLAQLDASNLFLIALDQERHWYRYHALFRDFLYSVLLRKHPEKIDMLHRRASLWYERQGMIAEAIDHALAGIDNGRAAILIERIARTLWLQGEWKIILNWIERLPEENIYPELGLFHAWALIANSQLRVAEKRLDAVENGLRPPAQAIAVSRRKHPFYPAHAVIELSVLRATIARIREDAPRTIALSLQALKHITAEDDLLQSIIFLNLGHAYRLQGQIDKAIEAFSRSIMHGQEIQNIHTLLLARSSLAELYISKGALYEAAQLLDETIQFATRHRAQQLPLMSLIYIKKGELLYEWNSLGEAAQSIERGIEIGKQYQSATIRYVVRGYLALARLAQVQGDEGGVQKNLTLAEQLIQRPGHASIQSQIVATQIRLPLTVSRVAAASRWAAGSDLTIEDTLVVQQERDYLTLARILLAQRKTGPALRLLERLRQFAESNGRAGSVIEISLLEAMAHQAQRQKRHALSRLCQALALAEPGGYLRIFLDEGGALLPIINGLMDGRKEKRAAENVPEAYLSRLLPYLGQAYPFSSLQQEPQLVQRSQRIELSEREREVLDYLVAGLTNQTIAQIMMVEVSTVKTHLKHIYRKLNVDNRLQAVAAARNVEMSSNNGSSAY